MNLYEIGSNYIKRAKSYIDANVTKTPKGFVESSIKSFTISFFVSVLFAEKNHLNAGLRGGGLSFMATIIDATIRELIPKIPNNWAQKINNPLAHSEILAEVVKVSFGVTLFAGYLLNLQINNKASCVATLPLFLWNIGNRESPPLFAIVAHG